MRDKPKGPCVALFFSIHYVLKAEQVLKRHGIAMDMVPVPRQISSDCGMAIEFSFEHLAAVMAIFNREGLEVAGLFLKEAEGIFTELRRTEP